MEARDVAQQIFRGGFWSSGFSLIFGIFLIIFRLLELELMHFEGLNQDNP